MSQREKPSQLCFSNSRAWTCVLICLGGSLFAPPPPPTRALPSNLYQALILKVIFVQDRLVGSVRCQLCQRSINKLSCFCRRLFRKMPVHEGILQNAIQESTVAECRRASVQALLRQCLITGITVNLDVAAKAQQPLPVEFRPYHWYRYLSTRFCDVTQEYDFICTKNIEEISEHSFHHAILWDTSGKSQRSWITGVRKLLTVPTGIFGTELVIETYHAHVRQNWIEKSSVGSVRLLCHHGLFLLCCYSDHIAIEPQK